MTTETEPVMGPPCDVCGGQEPAVFSLMQFADYSQVKVGPGCAEAFLRDLAGQVAAATPAGPEPGPQDTGGASTPVRPGDICGYCGWQYPPGGPVTAGDVRDHMAVCTGPGAAAEPGQDGDQL